MNRKLKIVAGVIAGWNVLLAWYAYAMTRETQRMLCHAIWKRKSVVECQSYFTGSTVTYLVVLGAGTLLALVLVIVALRASTDPPGEGDALAKS